MRAPLIALVATVMAIAGAAHGADDEYGIEGKPAPKWEVEEWFNLPDQKSALELDDFEGKVLFITFFQTMCGGCHQHGLPSLKAAIDAYKDTDDVAFVAIQTAFERFDKNDLAGARETAAEFDLNIPVGHQGAPGTPAPILWSYDAGGTPWTIIIDKKGIVRLNQNRITGEQARDKIDELLAE